MRRRTGSEPTTRGLTVTPRIGVDDLGPWSPAAPRGGWDLETSRAAALEYADRHPVEGRPHQAVAWAAWRALARAVDAANGVSASSRRSLIRADLQNRQGATETSSVVS